MLIIFITWLVLFVQKESIIEFIDFVCYQYDNNKTAVHFKAYSLAYRRCNAPFLFICSSSNFTIPWGESHRVYIGG